jgi:pimeloyl-ACP methyl ester carboxylesterase
MKHALLTAALGIGIAIAGITGAAAQAPAVQVRETDAQVNGVKLHYRIAGSGSPIVLIHGYAQTGYMWNPLIADLARNHTVIVPDLRGAGASDKPASGYQKKQLANDVHALVASLGYKTRRWSATTSA